MRIDVNAADDPRLAPYRLTREPRQLERDGLFVAESRRVVCTLIERSPFTPLSVLVTPTVYAALTSVWQRLEPEVPIYVIERDIVRDLVGYNVHRGCLAVARVGEARAVDAVIAAATPTAPLVVLEAVTDPDNVGSIFRSARCFGAAGVLLSPGCASPLYRKAIRTSLGASLLLPFASVEAWPDELFDRLHAAGLNSVALTPAASARPLAACVDLPASERIALLVGTEGDGLSTAALEASRARARIPMAPDADSLNAAVATAVGLYGLTSARR